MLSSAANVSSAAYSRLIADPDRGQRGAGDVTISIERREVHEPHAMLTGVEDPSRNPQCDARLTHAAGPGQRDEPVPRDEIGHAFDVGVTADQAGQLRRKVVRPGALGDRRRRLRRRELQFMLLGQDRPLDSPQRRARLEAQLLHQRVARRAKGLERVSLTAGAIQREHQLAAQPLAERMSRDEVLQLGHQPNVPPERQVSVDSQLNRLEPELLEPGHLRLGERLIREVGKRRSPPERHRLIESSPGRARIRSSHRVRRAGQQRLEPSAVQLSLADPQHISRRLSHERLTFDRLAQSRHVHLDHVGRARGRGVAPHRLDQLVSRHHFVAVQQQHGQKRALTRRTEVDRMAVGPDLERSEQPKVQTRAHAGQPRGGYTRSFSRQQALVKRESALSTATTRRAVTARDRT